MKNSGVRMKLKLLCSGLCGPSGRAPEGTEKVLQGNVEGVFRVRHQNRNQVAEDSNKLRPVRPVHRHRLHKVPAVLRRSRFSLKRAHERV